MNSFISWKPAICAPVAVSPASCSSPFTSWPGGRLNTAWKPGGRAPPPVMKWSIAPATLAAFCGAFGGKRPARLANWKVRKTLFGS